MTKTRQALALLASLACCYAVAGLGAVASASARDFYADLAKPAWSPPGWIFGPVWTVLYTLMAIAAWLIWRKRGFSCEPGPLTLFALQLAANGLWSWLFFAWRLGAGSTVEIALLWLLIIATTISFARIDRLASALMIPYLAWVTFAAGLCYKIWSLNPNILG
jgi:tryptophan-rich sensory protein